MYVWLVVADRSQCLFSCCFLLLVNATPFELLLYDYCWYIKARSNGSEIYELVQDGIVTTSQTVKHCVFTWITGDGLGNLRRLVQASLIPQNWWILEMMLENDKFTASESVYHWLTVKAIGTDSHHQRRWTSCAICHRTSKVYIYLVIILCEYMVMANSGIRHIGKYCVASVPHATGIPATPLGRTW